MSDRWSTRSRHSLLSRITHPYQTVIRPKFPFKLLMNIYRSIHRCPESTARESYSIPLQLSSFHERPHSVATHTLTPSTRSISLSICGKHKTPESLFWLRKPWTVAGERHSVQADARTHGVSRHPLTSCVRPLWHAHPSRARLAHTRAVTVSRDRAHTHAAWQVPLLNRRQCQNHAAVVCQHVRAGRSFLARGFAFA